MPPLTDRAIEEAVRRTLPDVEAIILFGSRATGMAGADSDLDLAVMLPRRLDAVALWEAAEVVARMLETDVDLVDLRTASTVMQFQIISTGRRLFVSGPAADTYEAFVLAEMTALNEARAPLLDDIRREGRIHGR